MKKSSLLFWFQIIMAWVYSVPQIYGILSGKTEGLTLVLYASFMCYLGFSWFLALAAYQEKSDVVRKQTLIVFSQWLVLVFAILILGLNRVIWREGDTLISLIILCLSISTLIAFEGIKNPFSKGWLAVWSKSLPQLWLAYVIYSEGGGSGLPLITLIAGHMTSIPRLSQVIWSGIRGGWDKPTQSLLLGESMNVLTWSVVTGSWFLF